MSTLDHYVSCALWASIDDAGEPLDNDYDKSDIHPGTLATMASDLEDFTQANKVLLDQSGLSDEQIGHDFWLNRNRHGAGFWDRGLGEVGTLLSEAAKVYGSVYLYVGDDAMIHQG